MARLLPVLSAVNRFPCSWCVAVRPAVRSGPAPGGALPWRMRGSARCTGSSGLGDTAAPIPAGGEPVREAHNVSRAVARYARVVRFPSPLPARQNGRMTTLVVHRHLAFAGGAFTFRCALPYSLLYAVVMAAWT